ncbi:MAG: T9SS type A sorting domain-containing protein [Chitinophagaceae bacterium]|nr:T9SS type A sorting domain-containing protein [Chitinophagaceae bacterium]
MKKSFTLVVLWVLFISLNAIALPKLSSFPSARATIFLDFDGHRVVSSSWNGGAPLNCAASSFNDTQITEVFNRVSEDYRPFNINITTDSTVFLAAPLTSRIRIVVTTTSAWYPNVGGISYTGSFKWGDDTPGFVFVDKLAYNTKYVGECCSHEAGHTVGLSHQAKYDANCTFITTYNDGYGTGEIGWAPIMGNSYYKNFSGWNNGPTPNGCASNQDNLSIITSNNGFTYRPDDYSDDPNTNPALITITNQAFNVSGLITTTTDKDAFKIVLPQNGTLHLNASPYSVGINDDGADLDIKLTLLNAAKQTINTYNPATLLSATIDTALTAGTYYIVLDGTGNANISDYGSLGSYTINGTFASGILPIKDVALSGKIENDKHNLSWNIISDDPIKTIEIQSSADGTNFKSLTNVAASAKNFLYNPFTTGNVFYRLKVTSVIDQTVYSNVIVLRSAALVVKPFTVSTLVHDAIVVNASEDYQFLLADMSGRIIMKGNNNAGVNRININNVPNGMYLIQMVGNTAKATERIVKQ